MRALGGGRGDGDGGCLAGARAVRRQSRVGAFPELRAVNAAVVSGTITGVVSDDRGGPLPGAMVSLLGATMAMTVTDVQGRFSLDKLPAGDYTLRAHLPGFAASRREHVRVGPAAAAPYRLELRRLDAPVATTGRMPDTLPARPIIAAGFGLPAVESATAGPGRRRRSLPQRYGLAPPSSHAQHPERFGEQRGGAVRGRRRRAGRVDVRPHETAVGLGGHGALRRPAVLGRSESAHDRRRSRRAGSSTATACRAAWPTSRSARRRRPATGRSARR